VSSGTLNTEPCCAVVELVSLAAGVSCDIVMTCHISTYARRPRRRARRVLTTARASLHTSSTGKSHACTSVSQSPSHYCPS